MARSWWRHPDERVVEVEHGSSAAVPLQCCPGAGRRAGRDAAPWPTPRAETRRIWSTTRSYRARRSGAEQRMVGCQQWVRATTSSGRWSAASAPAGNDHRSACVCSCAVARPSACRWRGAATRLDVRARAARRTAPPATTGPATARTPRRSSHRRRVSCGTGTDTSVSAASAASHAISARSVRRRLARVHVQPQREPCDRRWCRPGTWC